MKMKCPLCHAERNEQTEGGNELCETCNDIIEFGYPSFPAYLLKEQKATTNENEQCSHGSNGHRLIAVG
jgi:hypothetical protein